MSLLLTTGLGSQLPFFFFFFLRFYLLYVWQHWVLGAAHRRRSPAAVNRDLCLAAVPGLHGRWACFLLRSTGSVVGHNGCCAHVGSFWTMGFMGGGPLLPQPRLWLFHGPSPPLWPAPEGNLPWGCLLHPVCTHITQEPSIGAAPSPSLSLPFSSPENPVSRALTPGERQSRLRGSDLLLHARPGQEPCLSLPFQGWPSVPSRDPGVGDPEGGISFPPGTFVGQGRVQARP